MAHACLVILCIATLLINVLSDPALAPSRKMETKERKTQEKPIIVRRVPSAYFYPFSLWPLPKYPAEGSEDYERYHTRSIKYVQVKKNKR